MTGHAKDWADYRFRPWRDGVSADVTHWRDPQWWNRSAEDADAVRKVLCESDVFEDREELRLPRARLWDLITRTPNLDWLLMTRHPERAAAWLDRWADLSGESAEPRLVRGPDATRQAHPSGRGQIYADILESMGTPPDGCAYPTFDWMEGSRWWPEMLDNVWIGLPASTQEAVDRGVPELLKCRAVVRFLYLVPTEAITLARWLPTERYYLAKCRDCGLVQSSEFFDVYRFHDDHPKTGIDWAIASGQSGPDARPMHPNWPRAIRDQCQAAGVPFWFAGHGEWIGMPDYSVLTHGPIEKYNYRMLFSDGVDAASIPKDQRRAYGQRRNELPESVMRIGAAAAGRTLDGRKWSDSPAIAAERR